MRRSQILTARANNPMKMKIRKTIDLLSKELIAKHDIADIGWSKEGVVVIVTTEEQVLELRDKHRSRLWDYSSRAKPSSPEAKGQAYLNPQCLVRVSPRGTVTLFARKDGQEIAEFCGGRHLAWSHDNSHVLSRSQETLTLWDATTGKITCSMTLGSTEPKSMALAPDASFVLLGFAQHVERWDLHNAKRLQVYEDRLLVLLDRRAISPNGQQVIAGCSDGIIKLWDVLSGEQIWSNHVGTHEPQFFVFSDDGRFVLSSGSFGVIKVWKLENGQEMCTLDAGSSSASQAVFTNCGTEVLVACSDSKVRRFALAHGKQLESFDSNMPMALAPNGELFLSSIRSRHTAFDIDNGTFSHDWNPENIYPSPVDDDDGTYMVADGRVIHWQDEDFESRGETWIVDRNGRSSPRVEANGIARAFGSEHAYLLASSLMHGGIELYGPRRKWSEQAMARLASLDFGHYDLCRAAFSPDEATIAIVTHTGQVVLVDLL